MRAKLLAFIHKRRVTLGYFLIPLLLFSHPQWDFLWIGFLVTSGGLMLRAWAAGHVKKNRILTYSGPYAFVRHPLYLGTFLIGLGLFIATGSLGFLVIYLLSFLMLYLPSIRLEDKKLKETFPETYPWYHRSVPAILPRMTPVRDLAGGTATRFQGSLYRNSREYRALFVVLSLFVLMSAKAYFKI